MSKYLSKQDIFAAQDIEYRDVDCPEWGGTVRVRGMTGSERDAYEESLIKGRGKQRDVNMKNARAKLIMICAVDGEGKDVFDETDLAALAKKSSKPIDRLFSVCQKLSGISEEDMEDLVKNSEKTTTP